jgi:Fe-S cluster assembly ATP-binding protein
MLSIKNLTVRIENREIIKDFSLRIKSGELHVLMGPNGSGKSTLAKAVVEQTKLDGAVFLGFQTPVVVPGVNYVTFLRLAYNHRHRALRPLEFYEYLKSRADLLAVPHDWLSRNLNEGFSGGEKKRLEMLQALVLRPKFAVLDEPDTGADVDSLKIIAKAINLLLGEGAGILLITHYGRLTDYLRPDRVHVLKTGRLVKSGGPELIKIIEKQGYAKF